MERVPLYVDDMGETVFSDDLRAGLYLIRLRAKMGLKTPNKAGRLANKRKRRVAELTRKARAEQRADELSFYRMQRGWVDSPGFMPYTGGSLAEHLTKLAEERSITYIPRTNRWD